jgi:hypothetical protein
MRLKKSLSKTVFDKLINPLNGLVDKSNYKRKCKRLTDQQWIETGLLRVLSQEPSGRAFVQKLFDLGRTRISHSLFFETLKSNRRLNLCRQVGISLYEDMKSIYSQDDPLIKYPQLEEYDIYAGDGHYHAAACHDVKKSGKKHPVQHFYSVDLRTHGLRHLTLADTTGKRKKEHDIRALKRLDMETLRQGAEKGRKVIYVWDKAGIDFLQWYKWKHSGGIYFISREKDNMDLLKIADLGFDNKDPINTGVLNYDLVGCSAGFSIQRVIYQCPITEQKFSFITSLSNIPPGLIAYLYKIRWDIEKIFDQVKNKLVEKKAWATSINAKNMQAQFICIAHNLLLQLEKLLQKNGVEDHNENKRRSQRLDKSLSTCATDESKLPGFFKTAKRPTERSVKFIRWIRNHLYLNTSWPRAVASLRRIYAVF